MKFACSSCGACCKRIGAVKEKFKELNFPYQVNEEGVCEMLGEDNKCKVYESRPDVCRTDKVYENFFEEQMTKLEYYKENAKGCNEFMQEDGMDKMFFVDIDNVSVADRAESPFK